MTRFDCDTSDKQLLTWMMISNIPHWHDSTATRVMTTLHLDDDPQHSTLTRFDGDTSDDNFSPGWWSATSHIDTIRRRHEWWLLIEENTQTTVGIDHVCLMQSNQRLQCEQTVTYKIAVNNTKYIGKQLHSYITNTGSFFSFSFRQYKCKYKIRIQTKIIWKTQFLE